jgi:hypothetical protein
VYKLPGEDLWVVNFAFGDSVYMIMNAWVSDLGEDPIVSVQFAPAFSILGTALRPSELASLPPPGAGGSPFRSKPSFADSERVS